MISYPVFVMPMPLDKDGNGPAGSDETVMTEFQVWGCDSQLVCTAASRETADLIASLLNQDQCINTRLR